MPTKKQSSKTSSTKAASSAATQSKKKPSGAIIKIIEAFDSEPPVVVTGGSVQIDFDDRIFPPIGPGAPGKHGNNAKTLSMLEITDKATPPNVLLAIDLTTMAKGKCRIVIRYV